MNRERNDAIEFCNICIFLPLESQIQLVLIKTISLLIKKTAYAERDLVM